MKDLCHKSKIPVLVKVVLQLILYQRVGAHPGQVICATEREVELGVSTRPANVDDLLQACVKRERDLISAS